MPFSPGVFESPTTFSSCVNREDSKGSGNPGRLELHYEKMILPEPRQLLVVYHAEPGSPSEERLQLLASL
jgi:hypothetical protein